MRIREILEQEEDARLAPWAIRSKDSGGRQYPEERHATRPEFLRDRDRVTYSTSFRRLEYKTQVFPNHEGDHFRTRMTHTIEVANLSRTLARTLRLNEDFTECLALVHDIGHPPYGHCGEQYLAKLMEPYGGFEHNEQSWRLVTKLERRYEFCPGLNLTKEVNEAILQHTDNYRAHHPDSPPPLLETVLVSIADEMVYDTHDLDDGLSAGVLDEENLREVELWREALESPDCPRNNPHLRKRTAIRTVLNLLVVDFLENTRRNLERVNPASPDEARQQSHELLGFSESMREKKKKLEDHLVKYMYRNPTVMKMMNKANYFMERLFHHFRQFPEELPFRFQERFDEDGRERVIADYMAGMTDRYMQDEYVRLFMPFQKML